MKVSVLIPAYNEVKTLETVVDRVKNLSYVDEIVVVDDGSTDGTRQAADRCAKAGRVIVHHHEINQGKGAAVRTAMTLATGDIFAIQDADTEQNPDDIGQLLVPIREGKAKVVMGSRILGSGHPKRSLYFWGGYAITVLGNLLLGTHLTDMYSGYKVFTRDIAEKIHFISRGFEFEAEFVARVAMLKEPIYEVGVSYQPRTAAQGKKINWKDALRGFAMMVRCRMG